AGWPCGVRPRSPRRCNAGLLPGCGRPACEPFRLRRRPVSPYCQVVATSSDCGRAPSRHMHLGARHMCGAPETILTDWSSAVIGMRQGVRVSRLDLPNVGLVTPNLIDDAHDGTLGQADAWLRQWIPVIMSGPDWRDGRLAIGVVFDEADNGNQVPFVLIEPR